MIPFKETIETKQELIDACRKGFDDYCAKRITKNDFLMYFGFTHGEAIRNFYKGDYEQLLLDGGFNSGSNAYFSAGINAWKNLSDGIYEFPPLEEDRTIRRLNLNLPLQQIFYGAPGTGKSNTIKRDVEDKGKIHFRTTFHPDSDYSTFVGCYKPTMRSVKKTVVIGQDEKEVKPLTGGTDSMEQISYQFVPQVFTKAYCEAWNKYDELENAEPIFLIIEEINRGNCAQIFGDIFQLLDREMEGARCGFSTYPIDADEDLKAFLENGIKRDGTQWLTNKEGIKDGKLCLPPNLYIWATMNTSDQSLFPIDSAFKRRWDWKYVPIERAEKEPEKNWVIKVEHDGKTYWCYWWEFLVAINYQIEETNHSEDKQLGYFFCKANESGVIDAKIFVNKVIFYLWNDVFKDEDSKVFQYGEKDDDVANITRSGNIYFRHFVDNTDEMVHYFINQLFAMGKDSTPVVPIDYLKNDKDSKVIEHLPKMREDCDETPMPTKKGDGTGKVDYTYPEYANIFGKVDSELNAKGYEKQGSGKNSIDYKIKDIPATICYISARLNKAQNNPYGEVLLWMTTDKTDPEKSKNLRDKIADSTEGVFKTFKNGNVTLRTLEKDPTSIESINRGWVLKNPDIKFTDESLDNDAKWIYETMKILLERLQPIIEGALK